MFSKLALAGALAFALFFASPVAAQQCDKFDEVFAQLNQKGSGLIVEIIPPEELEAFVAAIDPTYVPYVTRAFKGTGSAATVAGLEVNGCLLPPIVISYASDASMFGPLKSPSAFVLS